jgi:hypothetical protein
MVASVTISGEGTSELSAPVEARPKILVAGGAVAEGDSGTSNLRFTITLDQPVTQPVTVDYQTVAGRPAKVRTIPQQTVHSLLRRALPRYR